MMHRRKERLKRKTTISLLLSLAALLGAGGMALSKNTPPPPGNQAEAADSFSSTPTNANISFSSPKQYAVILDQKKDIKRLYSKGHLLFKDKRWKPVLIIERIERKGVLIRYTKTDRKELLPYGSKLPGLPHLALVKKVSVAEIRYGFKIVDELPDQDPILQHIDDSRAYLVQEVLKESLSTTRQILSQSSAAPASASGGDLISAIEITKLDDDNFEIDRDSLRPLAKSLREGLGNPLESFDLAFSLATPTRLELTSLFGDATISNQGFTITRFGNYRKEELGLKVGDRILTINDKSVTSPMNAWGVVNGLLSKNKDLNELQVELIRGDVPITKTYHLK